MRVHNLIFILLFVTVSVDSFAQVQFGLKGGYNFNLWTANEGKSYPRQGPPVENEKGSGFHAGVLVSIPFSEKTGLRAEMMYSVRRVYKEIDDLYDNGQGFTVETKGFDELALAYLEMPLLLSLNASDRASIVFGPQFGYLLNGRYDHNITTVRSDGYGGTEQGVISTTAGIREMDIAFAAGFEVDVIKGFGMGFRYARSILSMNESSGGTVIASRDMIVVHQNTIQASIMYKFRTRDASED